MRERIMNVMKKKEDNKGFTLVELIVVIVILAILAAILIPGLLRWIDKAKEEQYVLEARNVYLAAEAEVAQLYAANTSIDDVKDALVDTTSEGRIQTLADVKGLDITEVELRTANNPTNTQKYDIIKMVMTFTSSRGDNVSATLENGSWTAVKN